MWFLGNGKGIVWQLKAVTLRLGREELAPEKSRAASKPGPRMFRVPLFFSPTVHTHGGEKGCIPTGKKPHGIKIFFEERINDHSLAFASARGLDTLGPKACFSVCHASSVSSP